MGDTVIRVEGLSKKYLISHQEAERYAALRDVIVRGAKNLGKKFLSPFTAHSSQFGDSKEEFFALKDISFEIKQGDRVGIIGRNGAGKSTLLKILSRITDPSNGRIEITGRVASLLEVGTGFHPELTGRENIFLNASVLGMGRNEIRRKFEEIVEFAEVEKFLDTPVKRYSSGMYVRLAFAVAAHLEPEILIVDEVLAVGDAQFQRKCMGKMEEVGREGRTILFVSHNISSVKKLCRTGIMLNNGAIALCGQIDSVIDNYLNSDMLGMSTRRYDVKANKEAYIMEMRTFVNNDKLVFNIKYCLNNKLSNYRLGIIIYDASLECVMTSFSDDMSELYNDKSGIYEVELYVDGDILVSGDYKATAFLGQPYIKRHDELVEFLCFSIEQGDRREGLIGKRFKWAKAESVCSTAA